MLPLGFQIGLAHWISSSPGTSFQEHQQQLPGKAHLRYYSPCAGGVLSLNHHTNAPPSLHKLWNQLKSWVIIREQNCQKNTRICEKANMEKQAHLHMKFHLIRRKLPMSSQKLT